jgi:methylmalonyl-CoA/ethylmalonyl-CoA epimerase
VILKKRSFSFFPILGDQCAFNRPTGKLTNLTERRTIMSPIAFGLSQIGQISVNVHDLERAAAFYRDTLGMKHLFTVPKMAFFDCNGIRLMLGLPEKPEFDHPSSVIYFKVDDIQDAFATLSKRSVKFEGEPHLIAKLQTHDLWMAFFRDSENNLLALMSEVARN